MSKLPSNFNLKKPILSTITNTDARQLSKSSNKAFIWSKVLNGIKQEIINTKDGKLIETKMPSNCCKNELFKLWLNIHKKLVDNKKCFKLNENLNDLNDFSYSNIKQKSLNYQAAKLCLYEAFKKAMCGHWITKPFEQDFFEI